MPKTVDEVTLVAGNELSPAPGTPDGSWRTFIFPPTGLLGYREDISVLGDIIASQIGTAINRPDRVYQPLAGLPDGATLILEDDPLSPNVGLPIGVADPYLDGLEYQLNLRGVELLIKGQEWQNDVVGGGWRYTDGRIIEDGQVITAVFQPQISDVISTPDAVARFLDASGIALVVATTTLTAGSQRKLIFIQGATAVVTVTLDATYPQGVLCAILTAFGTQKQTTIQAPGGQDIYQNGVKTSFVLGQSEYAYLVRIGTRWYVTSISDGWQRVGTMVYGMVPGANLIAANGQALSAAQLPRLNNKLNELEAALPGSVVSVGAWATNPTRWGRTGDVIITPKLGGYFIRPLDLGNGIDVDRIADNTDEIAGSLQEDENKEHNHTNGVANMLWPPSIPGTPHGVYATFAGAAPAGNYIRTGASGLLMLASGGEESRPKNVAYPFLIYI
jgi:hypothetical protein